MHALQWHNAEVGMLPDVVKKLVALSQIFAPRVSRFSLFLSNQLAQLTWGAIWVKY